MGIAIRIHVHSDSRIFDGARNILRQPAPYTDAWLQQDGDFRRAAWLYLDGGQRTKQADALFSRTSDLQRLSPGTYAAPEETRLLLGRLCIRGYAKIGFTVDCEH